MSEKTDSSLEDLDLGLTLWDGVLQLSAEVENWMAGKLSAFATSPSFSTEEDIVALRVKYQLAGAFSLSDAKTFPSNNHVLQLPTESDCDPRRENGVFSQKGLRDSGSASEHRASTGAAGATL